MSEKRILCIEVRGECQFLQNIDRPSLAKFCKCAQGLYCNKDIAWKPIVKDTCKNCKCAKYQGITRDQAIDAMLNGMIEKDENSLSGAGFVELAEAALDALLEANNEK